MRLFLLPLLCISIFLHSDISTITPPELTSLSQPPITEKDLHPESPVMNLPYKKPWIAVSLSGLFPGLGHLYLGDLKTGGGLMGTGLTEISIAKSMRSDDNISTTSIMCYQNTAFYSVYAAYRDVRLQNGQGGYRYRMPQDDLSDLAYAPFQMHVMKKTEVWGGILGALAVGTALSYFTFPHDTENVRIDTSGSLTPLLALPIGIGEESFFRGFVQPASMELCGSPWGGITLSSLSFGAAHLWNAKGLPTELRNRYYSVSIPFITSFGAYFGWIAYKNCSLKEAVAIHAWYDFTLMAISALAENQVSSSKPRAFAISLPF